MHSFRKTSRRTVRLVSRRSRSLNERLYRDLPLPDMSGLILYGQG